MPPKFDVELDRWSYNLAPFESVTKELYDWKRENFKPGEMANFVIDCKDERNNWLEATLLNVQENSEGDRKWLEGVVGYRVYRSYGRNMKKDE